MNFYRKLIDIFGYDIFSRARLYSYNNIFYDRFEQGTDRYTHYFTVRDRNRKKYEVTIVNNGNNILNDNCSCAEYKRIKKCEHIAAVLYNYVDEIISHEIIDELKVSEEILNKYIKNKNAVKEKLNLELEFDFLSNGIEVRLYVGNEKKYVLSTESKLINFLTSYKNDEEYVFGKSLTYDPNKHYFSEEDKKIINFLATYKNVNNYYYHESILSITNREFEYLLNIIKGRIFKIKNNGLIYDYCYGLPTDYKLEEEKDNYILKINDLENYKFLDNNYKYVIYNHNLYILNGEDSNYIQTLLKNKITKLSFEKKKIEKFSSGIFNNIKNNLTIDENISAIELPMTPKVKLYFDIKSNELICNIVFSYKEDINYFANSAILRDNEYEQDIINEIQNYGFTIEKNKFIINDIDVMYDFLDDKLQELSEKYEVFTSKRIDDTKILKKLTSNNNFSIGKDNIMSYKFNIDGIDTNELDGIFKALKSKKRYYKLKNNNVVSLDNNDEIKNLSNLVDDLELTKEDLENGNAEIPKYRALYIDSLKNNYNIKTNSIFNEFIENFKKYKNTTINFDESDKILRDYQFDGVKWLYTIYKCGFGGVLADEMGLGKSLQTITFIKQILKEKSTAKIIIVVPTSLIYNWQKEFEKFAPNLKYIVVADNKIKRKKIFEEKEKYNIFITSYGLIRNDNDEYENIDFELCVVDEAQNIKNYQAGMTKEIKKIKANCKIALTGTPVENNVTELWSIFDFIMPGYLNSVIKFKEKYNIKDVDEKGISILKRLNYQISPFILRRKKKDVVESLPDKIEKNIYIDLPDDQKKLYLKILKDTQDEIDEMIEVEGFSKARMKILQLLMKLRQLCIDPSVMFENYNGSRIKIDELVKIVNENILNGHKMLIFSSFKRVLDNIKDEFNKQGITYYMIDGSVPSKERMQLVESFNSNDTNCFLITLKSGGTGLNLTGADTVIHLDIWWNPQVENQATDRAHRIGQTKNVSVIKLITKGTIEERIIELQEKKKILSENLIEGKTDSESLSSLTEKDIKKLLSYND